MDKSKTGNLIREARQKAGYTQQELGDLVGVSNKAVSRWENGDSFPDVGVLETLSQILDLKIEDIVLGEKGVARSDLALSEVIRTSVLQKSELVRQRRRLLIIVPLFLIPLFVSCSDLIGRTVSSWMEPLLFMSLAFSCVLILMSDAITQPIAKIKFRFWIVPVISMIYCISCTVLIYEAMIHITPDNQTIFGLPPYAFGPLIHGQLILVVFINLALEAYGFYRLVQRGEYNGFTMTLCSVAAHMGLVYIILLYNLDDEAVFPRILLKNTLQIATICAIAFLSKVLLGKQKKSSKQYYAIMTVLICILSAIAVIPSIRSNQQTINSGGNTTVRSLTFDGEMIVPLKKENADAKQEYASVIVLGEFHVPDGLLADLEDRLQAGDMIIRTSIADTFLLYTANDVTARPEEIKADLLERIRTIVDPDETMEIQISFSNLKVVK